MTTATISTRTGSTYSGVWMRLIKETAAASNQPESAGGEATSYASGDRNHSVLVFTGLSNISSAASVSSASIKLRLSSSGGSPNTADIFKMLVSTNPAQLTWNQASTGTNFGTPGALGAADVNITPVGNVDVNSSLSGTDVVVSGAGITALVQAWVSNPASNFGILLARNPDTAYDGRYAQFSASSDTSLAPELTVVYTIGPPTYYLSDTVEM